MNRDLRRSARAGEAYLGPFVIANDGGVDVPMAIHLRTAQKSHLDPSVLEEQLKHVGHAAHHQ